jgi:carbon storage regulator
MLVLSRKQGQSIVIGADIRITVASIQGNQVRIGVDAPRSVAVFRDELCTPDSVADHRELVFHATAPAVEARNYGNEPGASGRQSIAGRNSNR